MERIREDDHAGAAGRDPRDLDRVLERFGAGVDEDRLLVGTATRREPARRLQTSTYGSYIPTMKH